MKHLVVSLSILLSSSGALAHDHSSNPTDYRVLKTIEAGGQGKAYIVARDEGHLVGQPFQVELRLNCEGDEKNILDLPIQDSFSVCDMKPESLKINRAQTAVAMKTKMADLDSFYAQVEKGEKHPQVMCQQKTTIKKLSLKNLCP